MPWPTVRLPKIPVVVLRVFVLNCASAVQCQATTAANQSATVGMEMRMTGPPKKRIPSVHRTHSGPSIQPAGAIPPACAACADRPDPPGGTTPASSGNRLQPLPSNTAPGLRCRRSPLNPMTPQPAAGVISTQKRTFRV